MATNIEIYNAKRRKLRQQTHEQDGQDGPIKKLLDDYLTDMKKDHAYIARSSLAAARLDVDQQIPYRGNGVGGREGIFYDDESPFKDMGSIALEISATEASKRPNIGKFAARTFPKPSTSHDHRFFIPATVAETPNDLPQVPKYHSYTTLKNNIIAEDDEVMRYFPYFGEDAEEDEIVQLNLEETFVDRTKLGAEEGRKNEYAAMYSTFLKDFLTDLNLTVNTVTHYLIGDVSRLHEGVSRLQNEQRQREALPDDLDLKDPKLQSLIANQNGDHVSVKELEQCERVCKVFKETTGMSMWEVVKKVNQSVKDSISPARLTTGMGTQTQRKEKNTTEKEQIAVLTGGNPLPYSLESYAALSCLLCYMHECPLHVNKDQEKPTIGEDGSSSRTKKGEPVIMNLATNLPGWSSRSNGAAKDPWGDSSLPCSAGCFVKTIGDKNLEQKQAHFNTNKWSTAQSEVLRSSALVLKNNFRCACLIASVVNKPCEEIHWRLRFDNLIPELPHDPLASFDLDMTPESRGTKRKKAPTSALPGYPPDCDKTHIHDKRTHFLACRHLGACTDSCPCVKSRVTCEKSCTCSADCPRRWRGCNCRREGRPCSVEGKCICLKASRECDPDLCHSCGAVDVLDSTNRYTDEQVKDYCQNVWLQRDQPRRTLLGRSSVAGFGLFVGEDVKNGQFLGEYKGEVITSEEADRRGKLYDKRGVSFLFNLNEGQVIDATRAGNKFRYVNHSSKRPNCGAKVVIANCTHRIGMFAKRDLAAGEELFFDYGYNNKQVKFVQKEPPEFFGTVVSERTSESAPVSKPPKKARTTYNYLKGGAGTTERSRVKTLTASESISPAKPAAPATQPPPIPNLGKATELPGSPNNERRGRGRPRKLDSRIKSKEFVQDSDASSTPLELSPQRQLELERRKSAGDNDDDDEDEDEEMADHDSQDYIPDEDEYAEEVASSSAAESPESEDTDVSSGPKVVVKKTRRHITKKRKLD